jgi:hypothetical protein
MTMGFLQAAIMKPGRDEHFALQKLESGVFLFRIAIDNRVVIRRFVKQ